MRNDTAEIWKDIPGYEGWYQVSNLGRVRSLDRSYIRTGSKFVSGAKPWKYHGKILKPLNTGTVDKPQYQVHLYKQGERKSYCINTLLNQVFGGKENGIR